MPWRADHQLDQKFADLKGNDNAASRGLGLELFLAELFGREHFRVQRDFVASGRQIDLFVTRGDLHVLVEAKWTSKRSQHEVVDEMRARLDAAAPGVVGLIVSMAGFSANVIDRVGRSAEHPILLMDGSEVEGVVARGGGIHSLIQSKLDVLRRERIAAVGSQSGSTASWLDVLPEASLQIVDSEGRRNAYWESEGDFTEVVNTLAPPDSLWAHSGAVRLDLALGVADADDLVDLLRRLAQLGWISSEGTWRLEQSGVAWSGLGPAEFGRQLLDWESRYGGRRLHHSEVAMYVDESDDGMVRVRANVSASGDRRVTSCELSFLLPGVPLDPTPYEALTAELAVMNSPSFRVVGEDPVRRVRLGSHKGSLRATPLAFLVRDGLAFGSGQETVRWVEGIVVAADALRTLRLPKSGPVLARRELGCLFVSLRQHHHLGDDVTYELLWSAMVQGAQTGALHVMGDWQDARSRP